MAGVGAGAFSLLAFSFGALQLKPLSLSFSLSFLLQSLFKIINKPPWYTYGLGKVDTASGSEHTTRQNRTLSLSLSLSLFLYLKAVATLRKTPLTVLVHD